MNRRKEYLEGLNTLRFFAAFLVLIGHCNQNLGHYDIHWMATAPILYKGGVAVDFFFVLSGFLLTYLARKEYDEFGTIAVKEFFKRRMLRIFPLYYLAVFLGYFLLGFLYPMYKGEPYFYFAISESLPYHLLFLPNYVIALFGDKIGAIYSLWSIGVEEQFYLFFPFLITFLFRAKRGFLLLIGITVLYFLLYQAIQKGVLIDLDETKKLFGFTLKFHLLLYGGIVATTLYYFPEKVTSIVSNKIIQVLVILLSLATVFFSNVYDSLDILHSFLFGILILVISNQKNRLVNLEIRPLVYLGTISFGIYVYHPFVSYLLRLLLERFDVILSLVQQIPIVYYLAELIVTIFVAHISYQYYEKYFLKFKSNKKIA